jgi:penicillin-binding protein 1A
LFGAVVAALLVLAVFLQRLYALVVEIQDKQAIVLKVGELPKSDQATKIYASDYNPETGEGTLLANICVKNRKYVPLDEMPEKLKLCALATEDARFFHHKGYDLFAMGRALIANVKAGEIREGASTITQQLVRNVYIPHIKYEKSVNRKVHEILLAQSLEAQYTKEEILEAYLNYIFLGAGAYGVEAAAETYFGKRLDDLTLAECALISGLPQAPTDLNPYRNLDKAKDRRDKVLHNLRRSKKQFERSGVPLDLSSITYEEIDAALDEPIKLAPEKEPDELLYPWFTSYVRDQLYQRYGADHVLREGMTVITTLDPDIQKIAEEVVEAKIAAFQKPYNVSQAALACIELDTGYVRAIVGGRYYGVDEGESVFNRATQAYRQPGSAFKPFTYATALEEGWKTSDWVNDNPAKYPMGGNRFYSPRNADGSNAGWIPLAWGLIKSKNVASVWLINQLGPERVIQTARDMGLTTNLQPFLGLTLGASEVYPIEIAQAFATFPQQGYFVESTPILYVMDLKGRILEDNRDTIAARTRSVLSENTAYTMVLLMKAVNTSGTGTAASLGSLMPNGGKTGTTDEHRDSMYIGYTPYYCTSVWCGNDDHSRMHRMFGGKMPAQIWHDFNVKVVEAKKLEKKEFNKPAGWSGMGVPAFASKGVETENTEAHTQGSAVIVTKPGTTTPPASGGGGSSGGGGKPAPPKQRDN